MMPLHLGVVMDALLSIKIKSDSTVAMMSATQAPGF